MLNETAMADQQSSPGSTDESAFSLQPLMRTKQASRRRSGVVLILCLLSVCYVSLVAEDAPSHGGLSGLFVMSTADTVAQGQWTTALSLWNIDYLGAPAPELRPPSRRENLDLDVDESEFRISAAYGLTGHWELSASIPFVLQYQNEGDLAGFIEGYPYGGGQFTETGPGDLRVSAKRSIFRSPERRLAASIFVEIPTGDTDRGISAGDVPAGVGIHWDRGRRRLAGSWTFRGERGAGDTPLAVAFDLPDEIRLEAGFVSTWRRYDRTKWITELDTVFYSGGDRRPEAIVLAVTGVRHEFRSGRWGFTFGASYNIAMALSTSKSHPIGGVLTLYRRSE